MPIPRKKSCDHCRTAKARCSLTIPCERCSERNLHCDYGSGAPRAEPYPIPAVRAAGGYSHSGRTASDQLSVRAAGQNRGFERQDLAGTPSFASPRTSVLLGLSETMVDITDGSFDIISGFLNQGSRPSSTSLFGPLGEDDLQDNNLPGGVDFFTPTIDRSLSTIPEGRVQNKLLSQRKTTTTETFLTAKVLLGQIRQYPKMMVEGKRLPPFIHPECSSDKRSMDRCASEEKHVCMPEILAVCANLIHLFYNRTPASSRFAWETIYRHQARLYDEV